MKATPGDLSEASFRQRPFLVTCCGQKLREVDSVLWPTLVVPGERLEGDEVANPRHGQVKAREDLQRRRSRDDEILEPARGEEQIDHDLVPTLPGARESNRRKASGPGLLDARPNHEAMSAQGMNESLGIGIITHGDREVDTGGESRLRPGGNRQAPNEGPTPLPLLKTLGDHAQG